MPEEETPENTARRRNYRDGHVTADEELALRDTERRDGRAITRILRGIVQAHDSLIARRRVGRIRLSKARKIRERFFRRTGQRAKLVRLSRIVDRVVDESADLGRCESGCNVGD